MNEIIKKAVKAGNSSAVILPRAWLNQEIRVELVEKSKETILTETLEIVKKHLSLARIIGVYIVGSYARGEETKDSDIDVLVITDSIDKEMIYEGSYNILIISKELLSQKLKKDLFPIGQMIKEAKALINSDYLNSVELKVTKENIAWYLKTTEEKLKLIKATLEKTKNKVDNRIVYTLILRIRTFYIIENLINNKIYSKKEFLKLIKKIAGSSLAYDSYLAIKNNSEQENKTTKEEAERLCNYLEKKLEEIMLKVK